MISADTNVFIDFFRGAKNKTALKLHNGLLEKTLLMNPFVLAELLSSPKLPIKTEKNLLAIPRLEISPTFFEESGYLRRKIYSRGFGIPMADITIAQVCIESNIPLLTSDADFILISKVSALKLVEL